MTGLPFGFSSGDLDCLEHAAEEGLSTVTGWLFGFLSGDLCLTSPVLPGTVDCLEHPGEE